MLQDAQRSMTMRELMTHSGGLAYALTDADPMSSVYRTEGVLNADAPLQVMIEKLGTLPLRAQPGTSYFYSISVDVQGYLVEKLSGQPFDEFLLSRIFEPLGMVNTAFFVPAGREDRAGREHRVGESGDCLSRRPPDENTPSPHSYKTRLRFGISASKTCIGPSCQISEIALS